MSAPIGSLARTFVAFAVLTLLLAAALFLPGKSFHAVRSTAFELDEPPAAREPASN